MCSGTASWSITSIRMAINTTIAQENTPSNRIKGMYTPDIKSQVAKRMSPNETA